MVKVTIGGRAYEVEVHGDVVHVDGHLYPITRRVEDGYTVVKAGDQRYRVEAPEGPESGVIDVQVDHRPMTIVIDGAIGRGGPAAAPRERAARGRVAGPKGAITAPMAGTIVKVVANLGDAVAAGDILMLMEAMKMENEIRATASGTVKELPVAAGAKVGEGDVLAVVE